MEKFIKKVRTIAILLIAILVSAIAFGGIYKVTTGVWKNVIPDFNYGMELNGMRELHFNLDDTEEEKEVYIDSEGKISGEVIDSESSSTEVDLVQEGENAEAEEPETTKNIPEGYTVETKTIKANEDNVKNKENYEKTKKLIQKKLEKIESYEYNIRLNDVTGELILEVPDNDEVSTVESIVRTVGNFEIVDSQNGLLLFDNSSFKNVTAVAANTESGYQAYLTLYFKKDLIDTLKETSIKYKDVTVDNEAADETTDEAETTTDETSEETVAENTEETPVTQYIQIKFDGQDLIKTCFKTEIDNGIVQIPLGNASTDSEEFSNIYSEVSRIADSINMGKLPNKYELSSDNYIKSSITNKEITYIKIIAYVLVAIISIYLIVRFKLNGLKAAILSLGYIGLLIIIVKYTKIIITINAAIALFGVVVINYVFVNKLLNKIKNGSDIKVSFMHSMKELYLAIIPLCIISVIFTFMSSTIISSIGMILFWGLFIQAIYDCLFMLILNPCK